MFEQYQEDFALLFEAGMVAVKQGDEDSAKKLFAALEVLRPQHHGASMGRGLIALHKMDLVTAEEIFSGLLAQDENYDSATAFLALTHMMLSLEKDASLESRQASLELSARLAEKVLLHCEEPSTRQLAQSVMDWHASLMVDTNNPLGA